jgi:CBS domain-containing protein
MTPFPYSIDADSDLASAGAMLTEHGIRHLPVTEHGRLVGLLSKTDIRVALAAVGDGANSIPVRRVCSMPAFSVESNVALDTVVAEMADHHLSTAVVVKEGKLVGILTVTDVCRLFVELLGDRVPEDDVPA